MSFKPTLDLGLGSSHTHAEDTPYTVQRDRLKNGMCPTCGAQVNKVKKSFLKGWQYEPLTIPGKVDRGCCLRCNPDNTATNTTIGGSNNAVSPPVTTTAGPLNNVTTSTTPTAASSNSAAAASSSQTAQHVPSSSPQRAKCRREGCEFFGSKATGGYCSSCSKTVAANNTFSQTVPQHTAATTSTSQANQHNSTSAAVPQESNDRRRVKKTFTASNGVKGEYDGEVDNVGRRDGFGAIRWSNGNSYEGEWRNDKMEGKGEHTYADGNVYVGEFRNDKKEGRGKWTCHDGSESDGDVYEGEWKDDKREGWGKYFWHKSGNVYEGEWKYGKREGRGTYTFASSGNVREGRWRNGVLDGEAIFRYKGGDVEDQVWVNDKLVSFKKR